MYQTAAVRAISKYNFQSAAIKRRSSKPPAARTASVRMMTPEPFQMKFVASKRCQSIRGGAQYAASSAAVMNAHSSGSEIPVPVTIPAPSIIRKRAWARPMPGSAIIGAISCSTSVRSAQSSAPANQTNSPWQCPRPSFQLA